MSRFLLLVFLVLGFVAAAQPESLAQSAPPNIVYILADDLGYGDLGSYGQEKIQTPHLDRLAREGMRFTQHYSGSPVCAPSRATLMTGLHTGHTLVRDNYELGGFRDEEERGQLPLEPNTFTLGRMLQQAGYATAAIGKWGLGGPESTGIPTQQGFDLFYGYLDQKQAHNYYPTHLWRNTEWDSLRNAYFSPHQEISEPPADPSGYDPYKGTDYAPDLMIDEALAFIREHQDEPFFLYFPSPIPHLALQVPDDDLDAYDFEETPYLGDNNYLPHPRPRAAYAAMISRLDGQVGQIRTVLEELGLAENTLIVFSSDNGPTFLKGPDTEFFESAAGFRGLKGSVYEGGIRVPMIAWWPGRIEAGAVSDHVSAFWDVMPTLAEVTGAEIPVEIDGLSFLPTLLGEGEQPEHEALYWEYHGRGGGSQAVRMGDWKGVRTGVHETPDTLLELYNLATDPAETENVADGHPDIIREMQAVLESRTPSEIERWNY